MGGVFDKIHAQFEFAREAWSKRPITFTVKSKKKTLADNSEKNPKLLHAAHSDISNINLQYYQRV